MRKPVLRLAPVLVLFALLVGCSSGEARQLEKETLFSLGLGILESDLNVFSFEGIAAPLQRSIIMRNGIFAISDGASNKIMQLSSYGDLLALSYQPAQNPPPLTLRLRDPGQDTVVNKLAHPYDFYRIGDIAFSKENMLLVQDTVPETRRIYDDERSAYLNHVVLRFNQRGEYQDYIGQEGIGGTAFAAIQSIRVTSHNHIVILSRLPEVWQVFWYNGLGDLLYSVEFENQHLPRFEREGYTSVLDAIVPDARRPVLLVKVDFHPMPRSEGGPQDQNVVSRVYDFDIASGSYSSFFDLPLNTGMAQIQYLFEFLGSDDNSVLYFIGRLTEIQHQVLMMNTEGRVLYRGIIELNDTELVDRSLRVNDQGILVGLLIYDDRVEVAWWRTDRVIKAR